jgi:hypothetical protein
MNASVPDPGITRAVARRHPLLESGAFDALLA